MGPRRRWNPLNGELSDAVTEMFELLKPNDGTEIVSVHVQTKDLSVDEDDTFRSTA